MNTYRMEENGNDFKYWIKENSKTKVVKFQIDTLPHYANIL